MPEDGSWLEELEPVESKQELLVYHQIVAGEIAAVRMMRLEIALPIRVDGFAGIVLAFIVLVLLQECLLLEMTNLNLRGYCPNLFRG